MGREPQNAQCHPRWPGERPPPPPARRCLVTVDGRGGQRTMAVVNSTADGGYTNVHVLYGRSNATTRALAPSWLTTAVPLSGPQRVRTCNYSDACIFHCSPSGNAWPQ